MVGVRGCTGHCDMISVPGTVVGAVLIVALILSLPQIITLTLIDPN